MHHLYTGAFVINQLEFLDSLCDILWVALGFQPLFCGKGPNVPTYGFFIIFDYKNTNAPNCPEMNTEHSCNVLKCSGLKVFTFVQTLSAHRS